MVNLLGLAAVLAVVLAALRDPCNAQPLPPACDLTYLGPGIALVFVVPAWVFGNLVLLLVWWLAKRHRKVLMLD